MTSEVIKSFLVGLGFDVDDSSLNKFNKAIESASLKVTALYASIKASAAGIAYGISEISQGFEQMGYEYRIIAPMISRVLMLRRELLKAYRAAGIDITKVVQASVRLNFSIAKTKFALEAIYRSVGSRFFALLTKQSDIFRQKLYAHMPQIQAALERFVNFIFKAFGAVTTLGERAWSILTRIYDFFVFLDKATSGWSTIILAAAAAWKIFNLSFLATPLGLLFTLGAALLAIYDDFKTFREGGQSLINWGSDFTRTLIGLIAVISGVAIAFGAWSVISSVITLIKSLNAVMIVLDTLTLILEAPLWAIVVVISAIVAGLVILDAKWKVFGGGLANFFASIGGHVMDFLAGGTSGPKTPPVGSSVQNANTNVNATNQTNINVSGSADAGQIGKAVAGEQSRVNFDFTRNLKGAVKP